MPILSSKPPLGSLIDHSDPLARGLIGWWLHNEGQGVNVRDSSGNRKYGTLTNDPIWVGGKTGHTLSFDGINDFVTYGTTALDFVGNVPKTFAMWIKPDTSNTSRLLSKYLLNVGTGSYVISYYGTYVGIYFFDTSYNIGRIQKRSGLSTIGPGVWSHIAFTWDGKTLSSGMKIYINGKETTYQSSDDGGTFVSLKTNTNPTLLAAANDTSASTYTGFFDGMIDDVRIYNRALSPFEIQQTYAGGYPIHVPLILTSALPSGFKAAWAARQQRTIGGGVI